MHCWWVRWSLNAKSFAIRAKIANLSGIEIWVTSTNEVSMFLKRRQAYDTTNDKRITCLLSSHANFRLFSANGQFISLLPFTRHWWMGHICIKQSGIGYNLEHTLSEHSRQTARINDRKEAIKRESGFGNGEKKCCLFCFDFVWRHS